MHRQLGDSLRRLAESQVRLFHTHVDQQLGAEGHPDQAWTDDLNQVAASLMASLERAVVLLYRRHFEHYVLEVTVLRAEAALERAGLAQRRRTDPRPSPSSTSPATPRSPRSAVTGRRPSWPPAWSRSCMSSPTATAAGS